MTDKNRRKVIISVLSIFRPIESVRTVRYVWDESFYKYLRADMPLHSPGRGARPRLGARPLPPPLPRHPLERPPPTFVPPAPRKRPS